MKYIIDIPDTDDYKIYSPLNGLELGLPWKIMDKTYTLPTRIKLEPYTEPDRKAIENEVWGFAKICTKMNGADSVDVFGGFSPDSFTKFSYQEAKAKYEEWKKSKSEIRVGDEVFHKDYPTYKAVVTKLYQSGYLCAEVLFSDGMTDKEIIVSNLIKTGRHFPEVAELLEKMKGEEE